MNVKQFSRNVLFTTFLVLVWILTSCGPRVVQTPVIQVSPSPTTFLPTVTPTYTPTPTSTPTPVPTLTPSEIVQRLEPSVVMILSTMGLQGGEKIEWSGTGVIFDPEGFVITAAHVVDGAAVIKVKVQGRGEFSAKIAGIDPCADLAVLKIIEGAPFETAPMGESELLQLASQVMILGYTGDTSPDASISVAMGIISQRGAKVTLTLEKLTYSGLLKTDAEISHGNSGGPLVALEGPEQGRVVGIVQLGEEGFGYAIPMESISTLVNDLKRGYKGNWLGAFLIPMPSLLYLAEIIPDLQPYVERIEKLLGDQGMLVLSVTPGTNPASNAGLQSGDVILTMQNISVNSWDEVCEILKTNPLPENTIELEVLRAGRRIHLKLK